MARRNARLAACLALAVGAWWVRASALQRESAPPRVQAVRLAQNPLLTVDTSPSLGDNVNGPSIIRVPSWVQQPLGRYYLYFAHHKGAFIRLAYADEIAGPWKVHEPGVLQVRDTAFSRAKPDPPNLPPDFYTHVASPEVFIDAGHQRLVMWVHGWWTNGADWPSTPRTTRAWAEKEGYGQFTQAADSADGLRFTMHPAVTKVSYVRAFSFGGWTYGLARLGQLVRSNDPLAAFEIGPNPFRDGPYANRVRHVALLRRASTLFVFFSGIGDAPERILLSTIDLARDWSVWRASAPIELLRPDAPYECPGLPVAPSTAGEIEGKARQLRDPAVFEEGGKTFLLYSICGEQGLAAAEVTFR